MVEKTYNPILEEKDIKITFFQRLPIPDPKKALLLYSTISDSHMLCITYDTNIKISSLTGKKYNRQVDIDLSPHDIRFKDEVLSQDNISKFWVTITATASISDPERVYEAQITDVGSYAENYLIDRIQDQASHFSIRDTITLKQELKDEFQDICYLDSGIKLERIHVDVRADKKYEEFLEQRQDIKYRTELERDKAKASEEMRDIYRDQITAIFSNVATGEIGIEEAIQRSKKEMSQDFDERMRQIKVATDYIKSLGDEMLDDESKLKSVKSLLNSMITSMPNITIEGGKNVSGILEDNKTKEENIYRPLEDDEDEEI